jgi:Tfp pilus assembly protein PilO
MKINNRQDFLVVLTVAVVILAVTVNFIIPPIAGWWSDRQKQIRDLRDEVRDGTQMIRREDVIRKNWEDKQANALPSNVSDAEQQFLKAMDAWSRDSGAKITTVMPQWKSDSTNYMTLDCRVESEGDLGALSRFIYDIERGPMAVRLDSVELSAHDNEGQMMTLGMELNGLALLQNNKK